MQLLRLCRASPRSHLHNTLPSRSSTLPWLPPGRLRQRIVDGPLSKPKLLRGWMFEPGTRQARIKATRCSGSKTVCRRLFSLTQYNHAWPRGDRGHQINRTGSPLNGPTTSPRNL